jgi:mono/diheme cytochrome c family protein
MKLLILSATALLAAPAAGQDAVRVLVERHCVECHDADSRKGKLNLEDFLSGDVTKHPAIWEKVLRRMATRQMPPVSHEQRPSEEEYTAFVAALAGQLDAAAAAHPQPGRTETLRRLNRAEYQNALRDLLAVEVDAAALLPPDESSHGFDNMSTGTLPATLLDRYITAAQKISRLAVGRTQRVPGAETFRVRPDITQQERVAGLPFGTRGGAAIPFTAPQDGEYEVQIRLTRDRNDVVEGLHGAHDVLVLLDRAQVQKFTVRPPGDRGHDSVDAPLKFRLPVKAGRRELGVTFLKDSASLLEDERQPYESRFNFHRHPRTGPALYQVTVTGPFNAKGPGETPSRARILIAQPQSAEDGLVSAKKVLAPLLRRAWRRPVTDEDVARLLPFFEDGKKDDGFDAGIEAALSAVLVSREFLFRVETPPADAKPGEIYRVSGPVLASRLSFFLWSSIPDDELLAVAERGELTQPAVLAAQARRMLADPRARHSLVANFAGQWLHLRNLDGITPDGRLFPDFDDNLRQSMRRETELHFDEILREDRSVPGLLKADHTFLNERLAKHYGIPGIYGERFRRVALVPGTQRGGLLRHASVLMATSYATRTAPTIRGKWILENILGTPPPPPAPDVPSLDESVVSDKLPVRQRLAAHASKAACAGCHEFIDPPGFALEHFDAVGRWRTLEAGLPVDAAGGLPDGTRFTGADGLENSLLARPEIFATTLAEKLLAYALGRAVEPRDAPAVREIIRRARAHDYRFSEFITALVTSVPFTMRQNP